ncbi:MAG: ATP synthase F0 subunit B [Gemmataceae bacterium]|nr:ATP synthase F0 subunit B [Gemmataceae bacterium]
MRTISWFAIVVLALVLTSRPAMAAKAGDEHSAGAEHKEGGKIDIADKFGLKRYDLGIFTLIVFFLLLLILGKFAWGPMMSGLDKREAALRKQHDDAESARVEANKALAEVQARLAKTNEEIRAMLDEARRDGQVVKDQMRAEASADAQAERERVRREIETARDQALQDIYQQSVMLAALVSTKAIKRELTPADHTRLLDEALVDLKANLGMKA